MSASQKILNHNGEPIQKLGVIAGRGCSVDALLDACDRKDIEVFIVAFDGQTDEKTIQGRAHMQSRFGKAASIIKTLKSHDITDLVFVGSMRRPSFSELKPDVATAAFLAHISMKSLGDDGFLGAIKTYLSEQGFILHGVHKFADELLAPKGVLTKAKPKKADQIDIIKGVQISQILGGADVGQAAIVQEGLVLSVEGIEGTQGLLERTIDLKRKGRGGVLVKTCKPQQDKDLDLPTIGPDTIDQAIACGLSGVVVHAEHSLILERGEVIARANRGKIFVVGIDTADYSDV